MDDPRALRLVTIGLVLAALAVGYLLFTGGFSVNKSKIAQTPTTKPSPTAMNIVITTPAPSPTALPLRTPQPSPSGAGSIAQANINQGSAQTLPRTGFPVGLAIVFSISGIISGLALRKFPR